MPAPGFPNNIMLYLYETVLTRPLLNALIWLYNTIAFNDLGIAIILLTILIRIILFPVFQKSARYQIAIQQLQPRMAELKQKYKKDIRKQSEEVMALYKEYKVNPFSGFLFLLIQFPILIALYHIFLRIFTPEILEKLYSFVAVPTDLNPMFLGLLNLQEASILIVLLSALAQYWQVKMTLPKLTAGKELTSTEKMGRRMAYIGPILTFVIFARLPSAVSLYWLASSLLSILQQAIINHQTQHGKLGDIRQTTD